MTTRHSLAKLALRGRDYSKDKWHLLSQNAQKVGTNSVSCLGKTPNVEKGDLATKKDKKLGGRLHTIWCRGNEANWGAATCLPGLGGRQLDYKIQTNRA
jgi:hypothetical protein